jgi:hypothetical protein
MKADAIIAEGERLAKPSLLLDETPTSVGVVAYWGGGGRLGYHGRDDDRHRITFDCGWLAAQCIRVKGSVGVYDIDTRWRWRVPVWLDRVQAPLTELQMQGGVALFGREAMSFPPIEAVCLYGGRVVDEWLASERLERTNYDAAATTEVGEAYRQVYRERCPLFSDSPAAILGGWHAMWPDDDFYLPREMRLVLWTFRDAEPWIEVFERFPNMPVRIRNT